MLSDRSTGWTGSGALACALALATLCLACEEPATAERALGSGAPGPHDAGPGAADVAAADLTAPDDAAAQDLGRAADDALVPLDGGAREDGAVTPPIPWDPDAPIQRKDISGAAELLVVVPAALAPAYAPLVARRWRQGLPAELLIVEDVFRDPGFDRAERLRNRLQALWSAGTLRYVLLGADTPAIPHRDVSVEVDVAGVFSEASRFASDLYYAALQGDWDANGDNSFARPEDDPDLLPDVAVARVPADDPAGVDTWFTKLLTYEQGGVGDYQQRFLLLSEDTGYYGLDSAVALEEMAHKIFPPRAELTRLYDDTTASDLSRPVTPEAMFDEFERGHNHVFHLGHGGTRNLYMLDAERVRALGNATRPSLYVTCACYGGAFQEDDAISEALLVGTTGGAVAYVGNTDVGIGFPSGVTFLASFYEAYFGDAEALPRFGDVVHAARIGFSTGEALGEALHPDRWTQLVLSIQGDPSMLVWREPPRALELTYAAERIPGGVRVVAWALDAQVALPPAGVRITLSDPGRRLVTGFADGEGRVQFELQGVEPGAALWLNAYGPRHAPQELSLTTP